MKKEKMFRVVAVLLLFCSVNGYAKPRKPASETPSMETEIKSDKSVNVRINPLGLLLGVLSGDVDFSISRKFTVGPSLSYYSASLLGTKLTGFGIGARGNYYLSGDAMTDSFILGPNVGMSLFSISSGTASASTVGFYMGGIAGYQWVWQSGFNINLGLGANYYIQSASAKASDGTSLSVPGFHGIGPTGELTIGWAF